MKRFHDGQRVMVWIDENGFAVNAVGTVVRRRMRDNSAFIALDQRQHNEAIHPFPASDEYGRGTHVAAYPDGCSPEKNNGR